MTIRMTGPGVWSFLASLSLATFSAAADLPAPASRTQFPTPGAIGGQAGAPSWESSGSSSDSGYNSYSPDPTPQAVDPVESAPAPAPAPAPQAPPLTIQVPGLPEIVIPGAGAPAPAPGSAR